MKQRIRLTESDLHSIINESVKRILKEDNEDWYYPESESEEIYDEYYVKHTLPIKMLYFLNEKEKNENITIDAMDWPKTVKEFNNYIASQTE